MKKIITYLLKQPWFYILCAELLLCLGFQLSNNPNWLYTFLPEPWYDAWEEFAIIHMEGFLSISILFLILFSGALAFGMLFRTKVRGFKKTGMVTLYVFLTFIALGMLLPTLGRAREKAKRISCTSNLKQINLALRQYAKDNKSNLPPDLKTLAEMDYLTDKYIYSCPSRLRPNTEFSDYLYYGTGHKINEKPSFTLLRDRDKNHPGKYWNILMSDGKIVASTKRPD